MHPITSNLWRSEDTRYTLRYRTGVDVQAATTSPQEPEREPTVQPSSPAPQPDEIDLLITKLSRQYGS